MTFTSLDNAVAGTLKEGSNKINSGYSEFKNEFSSDHLYKFTPAETTDYLFTPAARVAVFVKDVMGDLETVYTYGKYKSNPQRYVDIPLEEGVTYYLSLTGYLRNENGEKTYSWIFIRRISIHTDIKMR